MPRYGVCYRCGVEIKPWHCSACDDPSWPEPSSPVELACHGCHRHAPLRRSPTTGLPTPKDFDAEGYGPNGIRALEDGGP